MELLSVVSFVRVLKISCKDNSNCLIWKFEPINFDKVIFIVQKTLSKFRGRKWDGFQIK